MLPISYTSGGYVARLAASPAKKIRHFAKLSCGVRPANLILVQGELKTETKLPYSKRNAAGNNTPDFVYGLLFCAVFFLSHNHKLLGFGTREAMRRNFYGCTPEQLKESRKWWLYDILLNFTRTKK